MTRLIQFHFIHLLLITFTLRTSSLPTQSNQHSSYVSENCANQSVSPYLWRVNRSPPSYFFGTIHVQYNHIWPHLPIEVNDALMRSDHVFLELDPFDTASLQDIVRCQLLPDNQTLDDVLPESVVNRLRKYLLYVRLKFASWMTLSQRLTGLQTDSFYRVLTMHWQRRRPIWIIMLLQTLSKSGISNYGTPLLDMYLAQLSRQKQKQVSAIEKPTEQCRVMNSIDLKYQTHVLNKTLEMYERQRQEEDRLFELRMKNPDTPAHKTSEQDILEDIIKMYNCGNIQMMKKQGGSFWLNSLLANETNDFIQKEEKRILTELLSKRDRRMAKRVVQLLQTNPTKSFFFAFGAAHFVGNDSIIEQVRHAGFEVERYTAISPKDYAYLTKDGHTATEPNTQASVESDSSLQMYTINYEGEM